jgi:predicted CxxxxCH...CXXCH cytochrome family protein
MVSRRGAKQTKGQTGFVSGFIILLTLLLGNFGSYQPNMAHAAAGAGLLHNSDNLGTAKGVWGVTGGKYGRFTCTTCHTSGTTNIKLISNSIVAPQGLWSSSKTASLPVIFWNMTSFGDSGAHEASVHICEVCHSVTAVHRYNQPATPHNGQACTSCHLHYQGFKAPDCGSCHNFPPATGKHASHLAAGGGAYGQTDIVSTPSAYGFTCGICHNGSHQNSESNPRTVEVAFAGIAVQDPGSGAAAYAPGENAVANPGTGYTFNYSNGTCSNTYCHGNFPGSGKNAAPTWGNASSAACGTCHNATNNPAPASGSHARHTFTGQHGYFYQCTLCHKDTVRGDFFANYSITDKSKHANGVVNWQFDSSDPRILPTAAYSIPAGTAVPSNGATPREYGTCSNIYCHSIGQTATGGPLTGQAGEYKVTPKWGVSNGSGSCGICHDGGHGATLASGSHSKHLAYGFGLGVGSYTNCTICHKWKATATYGDCQQCHDNYLGTQYHVNGQVDVRFDPYWGNITYSGTPVPGDGFGSCANTYCHSNGTGGTKQSGETRAIVANTSPAWGGSAPCGTCHGLPPVYVSGSPKANSHNTHVVLKGIACKSCHVDTVNTATPDPTHHVNGIYDVSGSGIVYTYAADGGTCDSISCHASGRKWGHYDDAVYLNFRSAADLNNTLEPMANSYLTTGPYNGNQGYFTNSGSPGRRVMTPTFGTTEESLVQTLNAQGNYRVAQFVSPRLAQGVTINSGSAFYINIRNQKSSFLNTAKLRYALYLWKANDSQGTNFRTIVQDSVNITTTATNRTINFTNNAAVTLEAGDRIVCELEFNATATSGTVTNFWGNSNSNYAGLHLPVAMKFLTEN